MQPPEDFVITSPPSRRRCVTAASGRGSHGGIIDRAGAGRGGRGHRGHDRLGEKAAADLVAAQDAAAKVTAAANAHDAEQDVKVEDVKTARYRLDADRRSGEDIPAAEVSDRKAFYRSLNALNRAALCCSGGGIRSATFCLGVIQALAAHKVSVAGVLRRPGHSGTIPSGLPPAKRRNTRPVPRSPRLHR